MARSPRSEYVSPHDHGIFKVTCRHARSPLIPTTDQTGTNGDGHRVEFIEDLIRVFASFFCISVHSHAVMEREIRLIVEARPDLVTAFDNAEVARRWLKICPSLRPKKLRSLEPTDPEILRLCADPSRIDQIRSNLSDISWFLRLFQQRIAVFCNREDNHRGRFWGDRYRCIVLLDEELHQIGMLNVDLGAECIESDTQMKLSTCTSASLRHIEQAEALNQPSSLSLPALDAPRADSAPILHATDPVTADASYVPRCLHGQHLSPIRQRETSPPEQANLQYHQHRCSESPAISMRLPDYLNMLAWAHRSRHDGSPQTVPEQFDCLQQRMRLTNAALIALIYNFDRLFSHVAGSPEKMAAFMTKSGKRRAWVPPAARAIFNARSQSVAS